MSKGDQGRDICMNACECLSYTCKEVRKGFDRAKNVHLESTQQLMEKKRKTLTFTSSDGTKTRRVGAGPIHHICNGRPSRMKTDIWKGIFLGPLVYHPAWSLILMLEIMNFYIEVYIDGGHISSED